MNFKPKNPITRQEVLELNRELLKEYGRESQIDGIVDLELYNSTRPRILWILKEGNWGDDYADFEEDHDNYTPEEIEQDLQRQLLDDYAKNVTVYSKWKVTFKNMAYISHGLLNAIKCWDDMSDIDHEAKIDGKYTLGYIAHINVKKCPGCSIANGNQIAESYHQHKDFLIRQIELINPDIIFNGSGVYQVFEDLAGGNPINKETEFHCVNTGSRIIVNTYHTAQTTMKHDDYVDANLRTVSAAI